MDKYTFSKNVKQELAKVEVTDGFQAFWEALALRRLLAHGHFSPSETQILAEPFLVRRLYYLEKRGSGVAPSLKTRLPRPKSWLRSGKVAVHTLLKDRTLPAYDILRRNAPCRRAYLRGLFLAKGSVSAPSKGHHLEIVLATRSEALFVQSLLRGEGLKSGAVRRRSFFVVYLKGGDRISEFLKLLGANQSVLYYENIRAGKSLKSSVQRIVNMDRANVSRSVEASLKQMGHIELIDQEQGLSRLPRALKELARLRMENPDLGMEELGKLLTPPISKSAVNHRFRRIAAIASNLRNL